MVAAPANFIAPPPDDADRDRVDVLDLNVEPFASSTGIGAWGPGIGQQWGVPSGCYNLIWVDAIGGGASGAWGVWFTGNCGGGGGGAYGRAQNVPVTPGQVITINVGGGGAGGAFMGQGQSGNGAAGGTTTVDPGICGVEAAQPGINNGAGGAGGRGAGISWAYNGYVYSGGKGGSTAGTQTAGGGGGAAGPAGAGGAGQDITGNSIATWGGSGGAGSGGGGSQGAYNTGTGNGAGVSNPGGNGGEYNAWGPWGSGGGSGGAFWSAGNPQSGGGGCYGGGAGACNQTYAYGIARTGTACGGLVVIAYQVFSAIVVSSCSPNSGPAAGGTYVQINGSGFEQITNVTFGGVSATGITVHNDNTITCYAPAHTPGAVNVSVYGTSGRQGDGYSLYTYVDPPTLSSVSPTQGSTNGGQYVTVYGGGFQYGISSLTFGGAAATGISVQSASVLVCYTPAHAAGTVNVVVTTPYGSATAANAYAYYPPPSVTAVNPNRGTKNGGTAVTITGSNFSLAASPTVTFGGAQATSVVVVNDTTITCVTPAGPPGVCQVTVSNAFGAGALQTGYTYVSLPEITSCAPNKGPQDLPTAVTITGQNFTGATSVKFGGVAATSVVVVNDTTITCNTPVHDPGTVDIQVTNPDGTGTGVSLFTYTTVLTSPLKIAIIMA